MGPTSLQKTYRLQGLSFKDELEGNAIDFSERLVYLSLVPWESCNWDCKYCHEDRRFKEEDELTDSEITRIIREAAALGIRSLLLLGGEVLLNRFWQRTRSIVEVAYRSGMVTVIYTNGSDFTLDKAYWLAERNVSLAFKVDSLIEKKYDTITGRKGSYRQTMAAIDIAKSTSIGQVVAENEKEILVRLLFTTVGNSWNIDEYVALARFATNHGARWMMEVLNHRGDALSFPGLSINQKEHAEAMAYSIALNPEQDHSFGKACRLLSCVTVRKKGEIAICPQDYSFIGNVRDCKTFREATELVRARLSKSGWRDNWAGQCPIKQVGLIAV